MTRHTIVIEIDHHDATKALPRIQSLLTWASDSYGITMFDMETFSSEPLIIPPANRANLAKKRAEYQRIIDQHVPHGPCPRGAFCDCYEYAKGITILDWILEGAPND